MEAGADRNDLLYLAALFQGASNAGDTLGCYLSNEVLNLPLPMLIVGFYLGKADLLAAFKDKWSYLCIGLRLLVFPLIALGLLWICGVRGNVLTVSGIGASAPVGATATIFSGLLLGENILNRQFLFALILICSAIVLSNFKRKN